MQVIAWIWAVLAPIGILYSLSRADKPREPRTREGSLLDAIEYFLVFLLAGRVLGWW